MGLMMACLIYFAPAILAVCLDRKNAFAIALANLLTGWTAVGWIACLIWAAVRD